MRNGELSILLTKMLKIIANCSMLATMSSIQLKRLQVLLFQVVVDVSGSAGTINSI